MRRNEQRALPLRGGVSRVLTSDNIFRCKGRAIASPKSSVHRSDGFAKNSLKTGKKLRNKRLVFPFSNARYFYKKILNKEIFYCDFETAVEVSFMSACR